MFPKLIAFDLDYTLWDLWIDTHVTGPLRRHGNRVNEVLDRDNQPISFYQDVPGILHRIRAFKTEEMEDRSVIAACSRTDAPDMAHQCLHLLLVESPHEGNRDVEEHAENEIEAIQLDESGSREQTLQDSDVKREGSGPIPAINFFDELEIYPGSKITHFKRLHKKTGIPFSEMLFFDDEHRNKEVERLGVTFCHVPHNGLTANVFERGLQNWRERVGME